MYELNGSHAVSTVPPPRNVFSSHNGAAAEALAKAGWRVGPCSWLNTKAAKSPLTVHGHHDFTTDPDLIASWWSRWPKALIGAAVPASLVVLDLDPRNGGSIEELEQLAGPLPPTLTCWSGRRDGGKHLYWLRPPAGLSSTKHPAGIDLKVNGFCIMPPSLHPATKQPYAWELRNIVAMPTGLRELLRPAERPRTTPYAPGSPSTKSGSGLVRSVAEAQEGNRHDALVWAAYRARHDGIIDAIAEDLITAAVHAGGESEASARRVIDSVRRSQA